MSVDPRAAIDPSARLASDVSVGPFSVIGPGVEVGAGTWIGPHVVINGPTRIGRDNRIFQFASIGEIPQDKKFHGEDTRLEIGDRNTIREYATINRGTLQGGGVTRVGDDNWFMAYIHVAHDCQVGNGAILANGASLAGHVLIEDYAILGGFTLVHQFCRVGRHAFCGMGSAISKDVPPFMMVSGSPARTYGLNSEGLKRHGFSAEELRVLRQAYKVLYRSGLTLENAQARLDQMAAASPAVSMLADFLRDSERSIMR